MLEQDTLYMAAHLLNPGEMPQCERREIISLSSGRCASRTHHDYPGLLFHVASTGHLAVVMRVKLLDGC